MPQPYQNCSARSRKRIPLCRTANSSHPPQLNPLFRPRPHSGSAGNVANRAAGVSGGAISGAEHGAARYPTYPATNYAPPGHLESWLNQNRNVPAQDKEKMLRSDPAFNNCPRDSSSA